MKKVLLAASVASLLSANVQADTLLGLYLGGQIWDVSSTGSFGEKNGEGNVVLQDFTLEDQQQTSFYAALEHPIPLIPNIKIASTTLDTDGITTIDSEFSFGGEVYPVGADVETAFSLGYIDYTLYYEILDNDLMTLDVGITARDFDGIVTVTDEIGLLSISEQSVALVIPMVYASAIIGLPFTGLNIFAEGNIVSYDGSSVYDYQVGISYAILDNLAIDLDVTLGYRSVKLDLEDFDDLYADMSFDGAYLGAVVHF